MEHWIQFIQGVGFPIAMCFYLIWLLDPRLKELDCSIKLLTVVVARATAQDVQHIKKQFITGGNGGSEGGAHA